MKKCVETLSAWNPNIARDACMIFRRVFKPENYNLWQWWLATRICRMQKFTLYYHNVLLYFLTVYTVYSDSQFLRGNAHSKNHTFQNNDYPRFALCVKLSRFFKPLFSGGLMIFSRGNRIVFVRLTTWHFYFWHEYLIQHTLYTTFIYFPHCGRHELRGYQCQRTCIKNHNFPRPRVCIYAKW
jgi:hypothetical protein